MNNLKTFEKFSAEISLNESGKGYPISETEMGAWYECEYDCDRKGNKSAYFFPLDSSYYDNIMSRKGKDYKITSFTEFKESYPIHLGNNHFKTGIPIKRIYTSEDPYGEED